MMLWRQAERPAIRACAALIILSLLITPTVHAQTNTLLSLPEPYTQLYVIYNHPEVKTFSIELRNQTRNSDGSVTANIAVRSEDLIAYNLTFDEFDTNGEYWEDVTFLPLYPGHIYEIATITIKPGGYFKIQGTKFGLDESVRSKMTFIQMCILVMHLVGLKPPADNYELAGVIPEAFDTVFGPIGAIASLASDGLEIIRGEPKPAQAILDLGDAISEADGGADAIANGINLITKSRGGKVTGSLVKTFFDAINVLEITSDLKRSFDAFQLLRKGPDLLEATVTLAPDVVSQPDRYRVLEINETFNSGFSFRNTGSEIWVPEQGYELWIMLESVPLKQIPLTTSIPRNREASWDLQQIAPAIPGIYHFQYQTAINGIPIGLPVKAEIVVVPEKSDNLQDLIQAMIDEAKQNAAERFDEFVADLERRIVEAITNEIIRRLQEICGGTGALLVVGGLPLWKRWQTRSRKRLESE